ncbi:MULTISPECIES: hypothetical protein [unclassified Nocardia]|uniref:hypothetical protein n=1 Tax=unclassified Nocardia TaxID=2637762 RepID=UPI00278C74F3|nr:MULTISPECIES: hypothetical protein [unclassified Nocardia]
MIETNRPATWDAIQAKLDEVAAKSPNTGRDLVEYLARVEVGLINEELIALGAVHIVLAKNKVRANGTITSTFSDGKVVKGIFAILDRVRVLYAMHIQ